MNDRCSLDNGFLTEETDDICVRDLAETENRAGDSTGYDENRELTIEESFARLEEILRRMEDDASGLEETFSLYEEGLKLVRNVSGSIDKVEKKIRILEEGSTESGL